MTRHIRWGFIMFLAGLIVVAASAERWLDFFEPLQEEAVVEEGFPCPPTLTAETCLYLEALSESDNDVGELGTHQEAFGRCLARLQVADLVGALRPRVLNDELRARQTTASAALLDVATELCQDSI